MGNHLEIILYPKILFSKQSLVECDAVYGPRKKNETCEYLPHEAMAQRQLKNAKWNMYINENSFVASKTFAMPFVIGQRLSKHALDDEFSLAMLKDLFLPSLLVRLFPRNSLCFFRRSSPLVNSSPLSFPLTGLVFICFHWISAYFIQLQSIRFRQDNVCGVIKFFFWQATVCVL